MTAVHELLNKIKWDKNLKPEEYTIYYYDRILQKNLELKFNEIKEITKTFLTLIKDNQEINLPMHRIKQIRKKGRLIWER